MMATKKRGFVPKQRLRVPDSDSDSDPETSEDEENFKSQLEKFAGNKLRNNRNM